MATVSSGLTVSSGGITADGGLTLNSGNLIVTSGSLIFPTVSSSGSYFSTAIRPSTYSTAAATYTLPVAPPASSGYLLSSTTDGVMSWATGGVMSGTTTNSLSAGTGLTWTTGTTFNGSAASTLGITSAVALRADTQYIGTTAVTLNRATNNLALTGITSVSFPSNSTTTVLQGSESATAATYTLPAGLPTTSGYVLKSTTDGVMSWGEGITSAVALRADTHYIGTTAVTLNRATNNLALTGITSVSFPNGSFATVLQGSAATADVTYTLPVAEIGRAHV